MRFTGRGLVFLIVVVAASVNNGAQAPSSTAGVRQLSKTVWSASGLPGAEGGLLMGDPAKSPSIVVERLAPGAVIPWHWHTPNEHVMMVAGTYRFEIKGKEPALVRPGDFVLIPSRQVSRTTCVGPEQCLDFLYTDATFDAHFVDDTGKEIPMDHALRIHK